MVVQGGGEEAFSGLAEGEAGQEAGEGNSFMVTVTRLVVTSVTTTSLQLGAISGCQSGSPSAGTLWGSAGAELWSPGVTEAGVVDGWRLALHWRGLFLPPSGVAKRSRVLSSSSSSKEDDGEAGRNCDADAVEFASEDGAGAASLALWPFWVSV